jgi:integrase
MIVVNALLSYLVQAGYLHGNPLSLIRRRSQAIKNTQDNAIAIERFLDLETWDYLKAYISQLPQITPAQKARYERIRFLFHFLYLLAPRVSEVCSHSMNSFREYRGKWWWFALGKGNKFAKCH